MDESLKKENEIFTHDFLLALSNWQKGWYENQISRRLIADELVLQCEKLPERFKKIDSGYCFRKRFMVAGEVIPILLDDDFFEGIASWTLDENYAKNFKGLVRPDTKFAAIFKHQPLDVEVVVNINILWADDDFKKTVGRLNVNSPEIAYPLINFKDMQSEVILRSTLKGSQIDDLVGVSHSFETICDMANIPENERESLSIRYARDPDGIPVEMPVFAGNRATRNAIKNTIEKFKQMLARAQQNHLVYDWSTVAVPHDDDLKHRVVI